MSRVAEAPNTWVHGLRQLQAQARLERATAEGSFTKYRRGLLLYAAPPRLRRFRGRCWEPSFCYIFSVSAFGFGGGAKGVEGGVARCLDQLPGAIVLGEKAAKLRGSGEQTLHP